MKNTFGSDETTISHVKIFPGTPTVISTAKPGTSLIPGSTSIDHTQNQTLQNQTLTRKDFMIIVKTAAIAIASPLPWIADYCLSLLGCFWTPTLDLRRNLFEPSSILRSPDYRLLRPCCLGSVWTFGAFGPFHRGLLGLFK